jgi:RNA polymerase sigma factor (sigma-70 family)
MNGRSPHPLPEPVPEPGTESELVARAVAGEAAALEEVVRVVQDPVYRLALRMAWRPQEAEDATQEILIRVITRLSSWRAEASLLTWAYRIGVNYLLNLARTPLELRHLTFADLGEDLAEGLAAADYDGPEHELLGTETRLRCTQAMLQRLKRQERVAFVLGVVFDLPGTEAAWVLDITPAAYRKRLERARRQIGAFMTAECGLANPAAPCRCSRQFASGIARGRLDRRRPMLISHAVTEADGQMRDLHDVASILRGHPAYAAPRARSQAILTLLRSGRYPLLRDTSPRQGFKVPACGARLAAVFIAVHPRQRLQPLRHDAARPPGRNRIRGRQRRRQR